ADGAEPERPRKGRGRRGRRHDETELLEHYQGDAAFDQAADIGYDPAGPGPATPEPEPRPANARRARRPNPVEVAIAATEPELTADVYEEPDPGPTAPPTSALPAEGQQLTLPEGDYDLPDEAL